MMDIKKPRILIIGDQGQVGWELRRTLATQGDVIAIGRKTRPVAIDLADPDSIRRVVRDISPDWIINAAAYTAVDKAEEEPELALAINGTAPGVLAEEANRSGAILVHYSTDYVFDGTASQPYTEDAPTNPQSVYGKTKLSGEQAISAQMDENYLILRTSWVYGARGHNFFLTIKRLAGEREALRIVADQHGSPTWCRHIAEASSQILAQTAANPSMLNEKSGIYHLTAAGQTSWYGFTCKIIERLRQDGNVKVNTISPIRTDEYPLPAKRPSFSVLDNTKLAKEFSVFLPSWEDGLASL